MMLPGAGVAAADVPLPAYDRASKCRLRMLTFFTAV